MKTYQYKWSPVTDANLEQFVGTGVSVLASDVFTINIEAQESQKGDLDAYMESIGFIFVGEIT